MAEIAPGTAVRHTKRTDMHGRVRRLLGPRALVTWVRRRLPSVVRLEFLTPISDAELIAYHDEQEALYARAAEDLAGGPYPISPPPPERAETRAFLLNLDITDAVDDGREHAWPELTNGLSCE